MPYETEKISERIIPIIRYKFIHLDFANALVNPIKYVSEMERNEAMLKRLVEDEEDVNEIANGINGEQRNSIKRNIIRKTDFEVYLN